MRQSVRTSVGASDGDHSIASDDGVVSFVVRRSGTAAYVERLQPLAGIGKLSHAMQFEDVDAFDLAYGTDQMRYTYPLVYWRLRQAVAAVYRQR